MSLFVERKETRMATTKNERKYIDCPENDVHQQQDFIPKGFDFFLKKCTPRRFWIICL